MISNICTFSTFSLALLQASAFFSVQCQLFTLVASGRSSTIHLGSPSPHLAIVLKYDVPTALQHTVTFLTTILENSTTLQSVPVQLRVPLLSVVSCTTPVELAPSRLPATTYRHSRPRDPLTLIYYIIYQYYNNTFFIRKLYVTKNKCILRRNHTYSTYRKLTQLWYIFHSQPAGY